tara:strand:- start:76 stop:582 length:507 start_codon:yes stop_codon:yes gene_type:complete
MSKNLQKVQDMLDGNYKNKIQVGHVPDNIHAGRKVGDKWTDSDGIQWEQKEGYRSKVSALSGMGIADNCKDCNSFVTKPWDRDTFKADSRCYYCQMDYEFDLKSDKPIRWFAYRRLKDFQNMKSLEKDMEQWIDEMEKQREKNPFDERVANALANGEVEFTINKNKTM